MIKIKKNMFGYAHHLLLGVVVVGVIVLVGIRVLAGTHAQTPAESSSIGDATSITPSSDQAQTIDTNTDTSAEKCPASHPATYPPNKTPTSEEELTSINTDVAKLINAFRSAQKVVDAKGNPVPPLRYKGPELHASAYQHTIEMGKYGYFDHNTPKKTPGHLNGWCWDKRIAHYYPKGSNTYYTIGENIVFGQPDLSAAYAMNLWKHSPEHRRNMLDPNFRDLGVSAVKVTDPVGVYYCSNCDTTVTIITTDFGARH